MAAPGTWSSSRGTSPRSCPPRRSSRSRRPARRRWATVSGTLTNPGIGSLDQSRPDPALRGPDDGPCRRGAEAGAAGLGAAGDPRPRYLAAPVRGIPRGSAGGRPRLRAAALRPAPPGGLPGPAREPRRRAVRGQRDAAGRDRPGSARHSVHPGGRGRGARGATGRLRGRAGGANGQRPGGDLRPHGPPGRLHRHADRGPRRDAVAHAGSERDRGFVAGFVAGRGRRVAGRLPRRSGPRTPARRNGSRWGSSTWTSRRIAPGDIAKLTALGSAAEPGAGAGPGDGELRPNARDEIWIPIVLVALLVLTRRVAGLRA